MWRVEFVCGDVTSPPPVMPPHPPTRPLTVGLRCLRVRASQFGIGSKNDTEKAVDSFVSSTKEFDPFGVARAVTQAHVFPVAVFLVVRPCWL